MMKYKNSTLEQHHEGVKLNGFMFHSRSIYFGFTGTVSTLELITSDLPSNVVLREWETDYLIKVIIDEHLSNGGKDNVYQLKIFIPFSVHVVDKRIVAESPLLEKTRPWEKLVGDEIHYSLVLDFDNDFHFAMEPKIGGNMDMIAQQLIDAGKHLQVVSERIKKGLTWDGKEQNNGN